MKTTHNTMFANLCFGGVSTYLSVFFLRPGVVIIMCYYYDFDIKAPKYNHSLRHLARRKIQTATYLCANAL